MPTLLPASMECDFAYEQVSPDGSMHWLVADEALLVEVLDTPPKHVVATLEGRVEGSWR